MDLFQFIATLLIGGGGIFVFVQFLIQRYDTKHDKQDEILKSIGKLTNEIESIKDDSDRKDAVQARTHILRFSDELYNNVWHSREYFEQTMDDIKIYNKYCENHDDFANGRTEAAAEFIKQEYVRLFNERKLNFKEAK